VSRCFHCEKAGTSFFAKKREILLQMRALNENGNSLEAFFVKFINLILLYNYAN